MDKNSGTLVKICGLTRDSDAGTAVSLGADAVGMVFYPDSPRNVSHEQARAITRAIGDRALKVGLFVNAAARFVRDILEQVPLDILQFQGQESQAWCLEFGRPYWKAIHVREAAQLPGQIALHETAAGILLDTWHPTQPGGTGRTFDWSVLEGLTFEQHLILAGGLTPENVTTAIAMVRPWAVDVSSGVEESPGIKSAARMEQFINEVRRVGVLGFKER